MTASQDVRYVTQVTYTCLLDGGRLHCIPRARCCEYLKLRRWAR